MNILVSQPNNKRLYTHACQYLVIYLSDDEKTMFVSEISRGHSADEVDAAIFESDEKEVNVCLRLDMGIRGLMDVRKMLYLISLCSHGLF